MIEKSEVKTKKKIWNERQKNKNKKKKKKKTFGQMHFHPFISRPIKLPLQVWKILNRDTKPGYSATAAGRKFQRHTVFGKKLFL